MLGPHQPIILQCLELTPALKALEGVAMELSDCAFPLLHGIVTTDDPLKAFEGADFALLVGAKPRTKGKICASFIFPSSFPIPKSKIWRLIMMKTNVPPTKTVGPKDDNI